MVQHGAVACLVALDDAQPGKNIGLRRQLIQINGEQLGASAFRLEQLIQQRSELVLRHRNRLSMDRHPFIRSNVNGGVVSRTDRRGHDVTGFHGVFPWWSNTSRRTTALLCASSRAAK